MWTKNDALNKTGCLSKAADDEPIFIIRGQDRTMPIMLGLWVLIVEELNGGPNDKTIEARKFADEVRHWQNKNGCKVPD